MHQPAKKIMIACLLGSLSYGVMAEQWLGPVKESDTLWRLATQSRPDNDVSMPQVIYALWQHNPQAFRQHNINYLVQGVRLKVPDRQTMLQLDAATARRWFDNAMADKTTPTALLASGRVKPAPALSATGTQTVVNTATPALKPTIAPATPAPAVTASQSNNWRFDHTLTLEQRYFPQRGLNQQARTHAAASLLSEWYWEDNARQHSITFSPFLRWDQRDSERHLLDLRRAYWQYVGSGWDVKLGSDVVFWGVTESQHLVDVINQSDWVASIEGEAKLGQPMLNWNLYGSAGNLNLYLLPYFRERTLSGPEGRLRLPVPLDKDAGYESSRDQQNLDFALRWSRQFGNADVGVSYFEGNNREPLFEPTLEGKLRPYYLQMQQLGLDLQWINDGWIWKLESIYRKTRLQDFVAATAGFEYTSVGVFDSYWDLGWIAEYQYDSRGSAATLPGQNDLFLGLRIAPNDAAGTEILLGVIQDLDNSASRSGKLEASMRLSNWLRLRVDGWFFNSDTPQDSLYWLRRDDYLQLSVEFYF